MKILSSTGRGIANLREDSELFVAMNRYDEEIKELRKLLREAKKEEKEYKEVLNKIKEIEEKKKNDKKPVVDYKIEDNVKSFKVERAYVNTIINRYKDEDRYIDVYVAYGKPVAVAVSNNQPERKNPSYLKVYPITEEEGYEIYEKLKDKQPEEQVVVNYSLHLTDGKEQFIYNVENLPLLKPTFIYKNLRDEQYHANKSVLNSVINLLKEMDLYNKEKIEKDRLLTTIQILGNKLESKPIASEIVETLRTQLEKIESKLNEGKHFNKEDFITLRDIGKELKELCISRIADINVEFADKIVENGFAKVKKQEDGKTKNYRIRKSTSPSSLYGMPDLTLEEFKVWIDSKPIITFAKNIDINNPEKNTFSPAYIDTPAGVYGVRGFWKIREILNHYLYNKDNNKELNVPKNFNVENIEKLVKSMSTKDFYKFYKNRDLPKKEEIYKAHIEANINSIPVYLPDVSFSIAVSRISGYNPITIQQPAKPQQQEQVAVKETVKEEDVIQAKPVVDSIINNLAEALATQEKEDIEIASDIEDLLGKHDLKEVKNIVMNTL